ncbi:anaphase promoting complex subunit cdc16 [Geranomyces michiganensis]|nr:anaphase promoting complex subunit cdc16 [Geranomyces michiganensis]
MTTASDIASSNIKSAMLYLMGTIVNRCGEVTKARDYMKRAMKEDPRCAENFINSLDYSVCGQDADFIRLLYQSRTGSFEETQVRELETRYKLAGNHEILFRRAEVLFAQCRFSQCIEITKAVHQHDPYHDNIVPMHVSCLSELGNQNDLFYFAHQLSHYFPERPSSWFAVGAYYLMLGKNLDARKYFTKCTIMDSNFGPGWLGFAHSFAAEAETDQAISAYATAVKLFEGMHIPLMHLGSLYIQLENFRLAKEYLFRAEAINQTDSLLLNELGVLHVKLGSPLDAVIYFNRALSLAKEDFCSTVTWETTRYNLAHAHRDLGDFIAARRVLEQIIELNQSAVEAYTFLGWISQRLDSPREAATHLQTALSFDPNNELAQDLLKLSMQQLALKLQAGEAINSISTDNIIRDDYFLPLDLERHGVFRDGNSRADSEWSDSISGTAPDACRTPLGIPSAARKLADDIQLATLPTHPGVGVMQNCTHTLQEGPSSSAPAFTTPPTRPQRLPGSVSLGYGNCARTPSGPVRNPAAATSSASDLAAQLRRPPPHTPPTPSDVNISFDMDMETEDE